MLRLKNKIFTVIVDKKKSNLKKNIVKSIARITTKKDKTKNFRDTLNF
jgi:hypothetical protein